MKKFGLEETPLQILQISQILQIWQISQILQIWQISQILETLLQILQILQISQISQILKTPLQISHISTYMAEEVQTGRNPIANIADINLHG